MSKEAGSEARHLKIFPLVQRAVGVRRIDAYAILHVLCADYSIVSACAHRFVAMLEFAAVMSQSNHEIGRWACCLSPTDTLYNHSQTRLSEPEKSKRLIDRLLHAKIDVHSPTGGRLDKRPSFPGQASHGRDFSVGEPTLPTQFKAQQSECTRPNSASVQIRPKKGTQRGSIIPSIKTPRKRIGRTIGKYRVPT